MSTPAKPIKINYVRAKRVFGHLLDAKKRNLPPFDKRAPQGRHNLPESMVWGSKEHAIYLMGVCYYMKGGIKSETAIQAVSRLHETNPELFRPMRFLPMGGKKRRKERKRIYKILQSSGLGANAREVSRNWVGNFRKLAKFWDGDPLNLVRDLQVKPKGKRWTFSEAKRNYLKLCVRMMRKNSKNWNPLSSPNGFYGFRFKMVSMFLYFIIDAKMFPRIPYPVPVDFHVSRVTVATRLLYRSGQEPGEEFNVDHLSKAARDLTLRYVVDHDVTPEDLADVLWRLSESFCVRHPGNRSKYGKYEARRTKILAHEYSWTKASVTRVAKTCGRCPILASCRYNIPAGPYYRKGKLVIRSDLQLPEALPLDLFAGFNPV